MNQKEYYYILNNDKIGPISFDELKKAPISPNTLIWNKDLKEWTPAKDIEELNDAISVPPTFPTKPPLTQESSSGSYTHPHLPNNNTNKPPMPDNHLVKAILVTVLCCVPLGIAAIIHSLGVEKAYYNGDYEAALKKSKTAYQIILISFILGVVFIGIYIILLIIGCIAS